MDFMTLIGLLLGGLTVYFVMVSGHILHMLFNPIAALLVFGGTFSATLIAYPWDLIKQTVPSFRLMFFPKKNTYGHLGNLVEILTSLSEKARRQSIESLQSDLGRIDDRFFSHSMQMVIDGLETDVVKENMQREILYSRQSFQKVCGVFRTMATLAPIFGLLGTLIGVVEVLRNLSDPATMGSGMAIAITTTFYGIFAANFLFLPIAIKLNEHSERDVLIKELIAEGISAIQGGDLPLIVRKKLNAFLSSNIKEKNEGR
ncbi:chemotaxis protein PomA [bacterium BMS3Abin07]|nr:chemotaxis protein PomA [bacterium BMS3Abin07]GBE33280.1 chemotaxis protein PomA [bacterium BMS3Bbin05]HDL19816.1 hypothetical protein [Nitrospirota bacterium]HDO22572.1 hypothetical protein [Nitrospirota bacterium]HDZ87452.1 hypothetical protein [Nitrospirota bacterium]